MLVNYSLNRGIIRRSLAFCRLGASSKKISASLCLVLFDLFLAKCRRTQRSLGIYRRCFGGLLGLLLRRGGLKSKISLTATPES